MQRIQAEDERQITAVRFRVQDKVCQGELIPATDEPSGALQQLHSLLNGELELRGFAVEKRVFSPHLTLARIKVPLSPDERQRLLRLLTEIKVASSPSHADRLCVMRSELLRSGARYTALGDYVLGEERK